VREVLNGLTERMGTCRAGSERDDESEDEGEAPAESDQARLQLR
jgi:hypothetical protein